MVIDAGPDFRQQMLRADVRRIDGILLTHEHKDHIGGIDDVRAFNYVTSAAVDIYAEQRVLNRVMHDYDYAFSAKPYPGVPEINLHEVDADRSFTVGQACVTPLRGMHYRLPVLGFRIGRLAYITDMNHIEPSVIDQMRGVDTLVINALRKERHLSHFTLDEAIQTSRLIAPRVTYLTHISHQMGLHAEQEPLLPEGVHFAYDGLTIEIPA